MNLDTQKRNFLISRNSVSSAVSIILENKYCLRLRFAIILVVCAIGTSVVQASSRLSSAEKKCVKCIIETICICCNGVTKQALFMQ